MLLCAPVGEVTPQVGISGPKSGRLGRPPPPAVLGAHLDAPGQRQGPLASSAWTRHRAVKQGKSGGSVGTTYQLLTDRKGQRRGKDRPRRERKDTGWGEADGHHHLWREMVQGKGCKGQSANWRCQLQTKTHQRVIPTRPPGAAAQHGLGVCIWMHVVNGTGNSQSLGHPTLE